MPKVTPVNEDLLTEVRTTRTAITTAQVTAVMIRGKSFKFEFQESSYSNSFLVRIANGFLFSLFQVVMLFIVQK